MPERRRHARASLRETIRHTGMLTAVARERLEDDPVRLGTLAVRRLPPGLRSRVGGVLVALASGERHGPGLRSLGLVLADRPAEARALLEEASSSARLAGEVAVELGLPVPPESSPGLRARSAWQRGDLDGAVEVLRSSAARRERRRALRLDSDRATYLPGRRLAIPEPASRPASGPGGRSAAHDGPRALHLLTNSLPWTQSGYALRSHGILRAQHELGLGLGAVTRPGYPVTVGLPWAAAEDVVDGVRYRRMLPRRLAGTPEGRLQQGADLLVEQVDRLRPTVLHTTTHFVNGLVVESAARTTDLPWVYEMRGQLERTWVASHPEPERAAAAASQRYRLWRDRELEMAHAADHVVVLSDVLRDQLVAAGLPASHVSVVPNAVDSSLVDAPVVLAEDARRRVGLDPAGVWVGSVTSVVGYEGLDVLLRATALLRADGLDVRCAVVGDGAARPSLLALADQLGLGPAVVLPGRVPREEAVWWQRALDVFVVPRLDTEVARSVAPLKPVEAMAVGRPVVASDLPPLREIARHGAGELARPGHVQDLADTLRGLVADPDRRASLAAAGRDLAASRTWSAAAARYRSIYDSLGSAT